MAKNTAMLPLENSPSLASHSTDFVIIGNPSSRRVELFQAALNRLDLLPARVVPYTDLLSGQATLTDAVKPRAIVRIESPGKDFAVERLILAAGADPADEENTFSHIAKTTARQLPFDKGRILYPRQWYLGFCETLHLIETQLSDCPDHIMMNNPQDILAMFDKPLCHTRMTQNRVPVPKSLDDIRSFDQLTARMQETGCRRVFVKLAHGSSASGVVAYRVNGQRHQATTTVEMVHQDGELCLYNSRRIRVYQKRDEIASLIDALCRHRVHVEQWLPKAGIDEHIFDVRIVVIDNHAQHTVVRKSANTMTNLHLLNTRDTPEAIIARMGSLQWKAAKRTCERTMACFPHSLYAGIDLLITPDYRQHTVLEINAFGDLLPGVLYNGLDTYATEISTVLQ